MIHTQTHLPDKLLLVHHHAHGMWFAVSRSLQATNESTGYDWLTSGRNHRRGHRHTPHSSWSFLPLCRRSVFTFDSNNQILQQSGEFRGFSASKLTTAATTPSFVNVVGPETSCSLRTWNKGVHMNIRASGFYPHWHQTDTNTESLRRSVFRSDV